MSAYQDKLIDQNYEGYRDYITTNFGPVSFKTFVQMVIMKSKKRQINSRDCLYVGEHPHCAQSFFHNILSAGTIVELHIRSLVQCPIQSELLQE